MGLENEVRKHVMDIKAAIGNVITSVGQLEDLLKIVIIDKEVKPSPP